MKIIQTITIAPNLPKTLLPLMRIARNLWWTWNPRAIYLFQDMDRDVWERSGHNPVAMLGMIEQPRLEELSQDDIFLARMEEVYNELDYYLSSSTWYDKKQGKDKKSDLIAYFSAEFGLHECLPLYSGGLGILAGDHMKSASDLGLPLVGVGLLYKHGYFQQYLNPDGWQMETYPSNDFFNMPMELIRDAKGDPVTVSVTMEGRQVFIQVWEILIGRVKLLMLDTDVPLNSARDRQITSYLYGGDKETRLKQEIVLGIGGIRVLNALDLSPTVCHMNEGHSAFMAVERIRQLMKEDALTFDEALEAVRATSTFTTHTPVPAGIDHFPQDLMRRYFSGIASDLTIGIESFLDLGRIQPGNRSEDFSMAVLAIRCASQTNGVSKLHGEVSRRMWAGIWPQIPKNEVPITHITNGVHTRGWLSNEMSRLYERYLGVRWIDEPANHAIWKRVEQIPAFELWRARQRMTETLISYARSRLKKQLIAKGAPRHQIEQVDEILDPEALTIGFARRFATYKRATLIFRDPDRLARILNNPQRPVQIIFGGKAHPQDRLGKELIHKVVEIANRPEFRKRIVFIENYDIELARNLVQGVDIWLNTPRRPNEASGTSGMKVTANGGINFSVLDGWWVEGYRGDNGWAIGAGEEYTNEEEQDEIESRLLYEVLENSIVPLFYQRSAHGIPHGWLEMMKRSIMTICPVFNTNRMVEEYTTKFYLPNGQRWQVLAASEWNELKELVQWKRKAIESWTRVKIHDVQIPHEGTPRVGDRLPIRATIELGPFNPDEIRVEAYIGRLDEKGDILDGSALPLLPTGQKDGSLAVYEGKILCLSSGQIGFTIRCYPYRKELSHKFELGLLTWWQM